VIKQRTRFIEHYPEEKTIYYGRVHIRKETFDEIFYTWDNRNRADEPHWKSVARAEVERMVGTLEQTYNLPEEHFYRGDCICIRVLS
jgi:hypothetical protein